VHAGYGDFGFRVTLHRFTVYTRLVQFIRSVHVTFRFGRWIGLPHVARWVNTLRCRLVTCPQLGSPRFIWFDLRPHTLHGYRLVCWLRYPGLRLRLDAVYGLRCVDLLLCWFTLVGWVYGYTFIVVGLVVTLRTRYVGCYVWLFYVIWLLLIVAHVGCWLPRCWFYALLQFVYLVAATRTRVGYTTRLLPVLFRLVRYVRWILRWWLLRFRCYPLRWLLIVGCVPPVTFHRLPH